LYNLLNPIPAGCGNASDSITQKSLSSNDIALQAEGIGMGIYSLDRYPIAGSETNGFAFGLGVIKTEQIDDAIGLLAGLMRR
jgi:hypothetical protein